MVWTDPVARPASGRSWGEEEEEEAYHDEGENHELAAPPTAAQDAAVAAVRLAAVRLRIAVAAVRQRIGSTGAQDIEMQEHWRGRGGVHTGKGKDNNGKGTGKGKSTWSRWV